MIIINQLKIKPDYTWNDIYKKVSNALKVLPEDVLNVCIEKRSIDARKKPDVFWVLSVVVNVKNEETVLRRCKDENVSEYKPVLYSLKPVGTLALKHRPVIVGAGPAGLFCAYNLARLGYRPIVLERGFDVDSRTRDVEEFFNSGMLSAKSNVLFGEGGAGTFSDGKLNTLVKDKAGRNRFVLETFVKYGASENILYDAKPHIGTDVLRTVIKNMREDIKSMGGEFRFNAEMTDISFDEDGAVRSVTINNLIELECEILILCIGHSARNTFEMLYERKFMLEKKDFAIGLRIEHKQEMIDKALISDNPQLLEHFPHAAYKLVYKANDGRGVYSFCMCPGGYVVNASSEPEHLCINGMSYSDRAGKNANSAIVVTINTDDFKSDHPLAGIEFQRELEKKAFDLAKGAIPCEYYKDYKNEVLGKPGFDDSDFNLILENRPEMKGAFSFEKISTILPDYVNKDIVEGIDYFERIIPGFSSDFAILSAVETRTSSPVRITRTDSFESINYKGVYPCGEGAGYAGGIMSAAMDGLKVTEQICSKYKAL